MSLGGSPAALIHQRLAKGALLTFRLVCLVDDAETAVGAQQTVPPSCHQPVVRSLQLPGLRIHHEKVGTHLRKSGDGVFFCPAAEGHRRGRLNDGRGPGAPPARA